MKIHLTPSQIAVAQEAIGLLWAEYRRGAMPEVSTLPSIRGEALILPSEKPALLAFVAVLHTMPARYTFDETLRERQRWGKVYACQNLKERVAEGLALVGDGTPIAAGDLSIPAGNLLKRLGVHSVEQLATWSAGDLRQVRGFGEHRVAEVNRLLARHGKTLRPDPEAAAAVRRQ